MLFEILLAGAALASAAPSSLQARQGPTFSASFTECVFPIKGHMSDSLTVDTGTLAAINLELLAA